MLHSVLFQIKPDTEMAMLVFAQRCLLSPRSAGSSNGRRRDGGLGAVGWSMVDLVGAVLVGLGKLGRERGGQACANNQSVWACANNQPRSRGQVQDADMGAGPAVVTAAEEASSLTCFRDFLAQAQKREYTCVDGDADEVLEQAAKRLRLL